MVEKAALKARPLQLAPGEQKLVFISKRGIETNITAFPVNSERWVYKGAGRVGDMIWDDIARESAKLSPRCPKGKHLNFDQCTCRLPYNPRKLSPSRANASFELPTSKSKKAA